MQPKTAAQLDREIADVASADRRASRNTDSIYKRVLPNLGKLSREPQRFIGKCKRCGATHQLIGLMQSATTLAGNGEFVVETPAGDLLATAHFGTDAGNMYVRCGDHRALLRRVVEGSKRSKHECGARCTSATGPNCDCRCRGQNHGSDL